MQEIHTRIWNAALPYQDKRDDAGHAFITLEYAKQLVDLEGGDPNIVLPAIILHDTGWSQLSRDEWMVVFSPTASPADEMVVRVRHQEEGVKLARRILEELDYSARWTEEIIEIISEHDTRKGFISNNEGLVRDADKLWRFSKTGFDADVARFAIQPQALHDKLAGQIYQSGFFYSETSRLLAREELERRRREFTTAASMRLNESTQDRQSALGNV